MKRNIFAYRKGCLSFTHLLIPFLLLINIASAQKTPEKRTAIVNAAKIGAPIDPYVYGMFSELLFNMFEQGAWAEMLSDRKFFYPVDLSEELNPVNNRRNQKRWRPVGPQGAVTMDTVNAYVGEHAPKVKLDGVLPAGIQQTGLIVRKDKEYSGRIVLSAYEDVKVSITLIWGPNSADRQTIFIQTLTDNYATYALNFQSGGESALARLEIIGTGKGNFHIGAISLMPKDNIKGFRSDIVSLLKDMNSGIYRWGGNNISNYEWRNGIGDPDKRPPVYDYAWNTVEQNDVGTDEFLTFFDLIQVDPLLNVNAGFGDAYSAAQWVEYVNGSVLTPMGKLRAINGHPQPYQVKWWEIGNEMYGEWQLGNMYIDDYIIKHNNFAKAMRKVDPTIKLIAAGATVIESSMTVATTVKARKPRKPLVTRLPFEYDTPEDWSGNLLRYSSDYFEYLDEHFYPNVTSAYDEQLQDLVDVDDPLVDRVRRVPNRVKSAAEAWEEYLKRIPDLKQKQIKYVITEWRGKKREGQVGAVESALSAAATLNEMFRHSDIIAMAGYTGFSSLIAHDATDAVYSPVGLVFKLYKKHFGTLPLEVSGNAPQKEVKGTVGVDKPVVSSGSNTYPLDIMASFSEDKRKLILSIVNPTESEQDIDIRFEQVNLEKKVTGWHIIPPSLEAKNEPGKKPAVQITQSQLKEIPKIFRVAPLGISLYEFGIK